MLTLCTFVLALQAQLERAESAFEARVLWVIPAPSGGGFGHTITPLGALDGDGWQEALLSVANGSLLVS